MSSGMSSASALSGCSSDTVQLTLSPPFTVCETYYVQKRKANQL